MIMCRYITTEELEQALREYGMHDGRDIKEIISEVDADNVSTKRKSTTLITYCIFTLHLPMLHVFSGWKNQLR